jgi:hypothetical protein
MPDETMFAPLGAEEIAAGADVVTRSKPVPIIPVPDDATRGEPLSAQPLDLVLGYARRGWRLVPIPRGQKRPTLTGWPDLRVRPEDVPRLFSHGENVGVILGPTSGDLVDIDLDRTDAVILADLYLPATGAVFGRPAKPRSHRLFVAPGAIFESFADPSTGDMLLELRTTGRDGGAHLTLLPPSITVGERREWRGDVVAPRQIDAGKLRICATWLAIACLVARYVSHHAAERPGPDLPRLLWEWDHDLGRAAYRWLGQPTPDAPQRHPRPRAQLSRRDLDLAEIVQAIPNDCDWSGWNRIGMAIFAASGGSGEGFVAFDDFSAKSAKYRPHVVEERWRNYRRSPPGRVGVGSLVYLARQCGWTPQTQSYG